MIAPKKFLALVTDDNDGRLVGWDSADDFISADGQVNQIISSHGASGRAGWVYKQVRPNSPNKSWVVSMAYVDDLKIENRIVTDCASWREALGKAFPETSDWEISDDYETAQDEARGFDVAFTCTVIDEIAL